MNNKLLLWFILSTLFTHNIHGMKRSRDDILSLQSYKKQNKELFTQILKADPIDLPNEIKGKHFDAYKEICNCLNCYMKN